MRIIKRLITVSYQYVSSCLSIRKSIDPCAYVIFQMAEVAVPKTLFREILLPDQAVAFFDSTREAGIMCVTVENRVLEWEATVAVCQNSKKMRILGTSA